MSSLQSKQVVARAAQVIFNDHDLDQIPELYAPDFIDHGAPDGAPQGPDGQRAKVEAFIAAFPDLHLSYSHQIAEDDLVAGRFVITGTHDGEFAGIAATGNTISLEGHDLLRVENGKIIEHWTMMDSAVLMHQLGQT
jgi:steroid delta-isomerase-like uncharacterized protein